MATCKWCGKEFDRYEEGLLFDSVTFSYDTLMIDLCADCANRAVEDEVDGVFRETCEGCGCVFDPIEEGGRFDSHFDACNGVGLTDVWSAAKKILCADCAIGHVGKS